MARNSDGTVSRDVGTGRPAGGGTPQTKAPLAKSSGGSGPRVVKKATGGVVDKKQSNR